MAEEHITPSERSTISPTRQTLPSIDSPREYPGNKFLDFLMGFLGTALLTLVLKLVLTFLPFIMSGLFPETSFGTILIGLLGIAALVSMIFACRWSYQHDRSYIAHGIVTCFFLALLTPLIAFGLCLFHGL